MPVIRCATIEPPLARARTDIPRRLPYVAQGAAQAIEDAGALTMVFSLTPSVHLALGIYSAVRKSRGEAIQQSASTTRHALHLPDGPEQEKRDTAISGAGGEQGGKNPDLWADREWQGFMVS